VAAQWYQREKVLLMLIMMVMKGRN